MNPLEVFGLSQAGVGSCRGEAGGSVVWQYEGLVNVWCQFVLRLAQEQRFVSLKTSGGGQRGNREHKVSKTNTQTPFFYQMQVLDNHCTRTLSCRNFI